MAVDVTIGAPGNEIGVVVDFGFTGDFVIATDISFDATAQTIDSTTTDFLKTFRDVPQFITISGSAANSTGANLNNRYLATSVTTNQIELQSTGNGNTLALTSTETAGPSITLQGYIPETVEGVIAGQVLFLINEIGAVKDLDLSYSPLFTFRDSVIKYP